jgi:hypothetical protein
MQDFCERSVNHWEERGSLYASWRGWADKEGIPAGGKSEFWEKLEDHGMRPHRFTDKGRGYCGLKLK